MEMRSAIDFNEVPISEFCIERAGTLPLDPKPGRMVLLTSETPDRLCVFTDEGWISPNLLTVGSASGTVCAGDDPRLNPSKVEAITGTVALSDAQKIVLINSATDCNVFLPAGVTDTLYRLRNIGAGKVTLVPNGDDTIENATSYEILTVNAFDLIFYSGNWYIL